jgi:hypothetical protein
MATSATHLWLILWRAYKSLREHAERHIDSPGLGFSEFAVLEYLFHMRLRRKRSAISLQLSVVGVWLLALRAHVRRGLQNRRSLQGF